MATSKKASAKTKKLDTIKKVSSKPKVASTDKEKVVKAVEKTVKITKPLKIMDKTLTLNIILPGKNKLFIADIKETKNGYEVTATVGPEAVAIGTIPTIRTPPPPPPPIREIYKNVEKITSLKLGFGNI